MDTLTLLFVGVMLIVGLLLTLNVRNHIRRMNDRRLEDEHQMHEDLRRRTIAQGKARPATRR
jgi:flagellar biosynthesis/type III secretory pathway M-ring protein FliF/YscJ